MNSIKKTIWMDAGDDIHIKKHCMQLDDYNKKYCDHSYMKDFAADSIVTFLYGSNKHEGTLPKIKDGDTHDTIIQAYKLGRSFSKLDDDKIWNCDGKFSNQEKVQMLRHFSAKMFISNMRKLSLQDVLTTHSIMMGCSVNNEGSKTAAGALRTNDCYSAGTWMKYPPPKCLESGLNAILSKYNEDLLNCEQRAAGDKDPVEIATHVFYDFVSLHPFEDGNGRMGRLLASHAIECTGTPFSVMIGTNRSRSRKHVLHALRKMDQDYHNKELLTIVASSIANQWQNFFNYIRWSSEPAQPRQRCV